MLGCRWASESENGLGLSLLIIACRATAEFRFLIFLVYVLDRPMNAFGLSLDFCCRSTRLMVLFTTARLDAKRALNCLIKSSYERGHPLDKFENQPRVNFSSRQGKVLHLTPFEASRSIIRELNLVGPSFHRRA